MGASRRATAPQIAGVLAVCALALLIGWWTKARCFDAEPWTDGDQYLGWCYTDVYALYFSEGLDGDIVPYVDRPVEYPVLTGAQMWAAAAVTTTGEGFFHVTAFVAGAALLGAVGLLARDGVPARRLLWIAAAPTLAVYAAMNWDAVPVLALVGAITLHRRDHDVWSGVVAGLGAAAKIFPGVLVPLVVIAHLRQGRRRAAGAHLAAAAGAWAVVNVPVALLAFDGWREFWDLNRLRPADWDSIWFAFEQLRGATFSVSALNAASAVMFVAGAAILIVGGMRRLAPEETWRLALPLLCWFLLTNKVYSPQFSLWLLPLFVLVLPRAAPVIAFLIADLMVFAVRYPFLGSQIGLGPAPGYGVLAFPLVIRAAVLCWIIAESLPRQSQLELLAAPSPLR